MSTLERLISQYGYFAVFGGTLLEGETVVVLGGFAAHQGYLWLPLVMLMAFLGSFLCDQALFLAGKRWGRRAIERRPAWRSRAARAERLLLRWQNPFIVGFRFIYGMRTISPLVIGASAVTWRRFLALNAVGAAVWAAGISTLGYLFGKAVAAALGRYERYVLYAVAGAIVLAVVVWFVLRRVRKGRGA